MILLWLYLELFLLDEQKSQSNWEHCVPVLTSYLLNWQ